MLSERQIDLFVNLNTFQYLGKYTFQERCTAGFCSHKGQGSTFVGGGSFPAIAVLVLSQTEWRKIYCTEY